MRWITKEIDLGIIESNYSRIIEFVGKNITVMPVIKADAYGHGAVAVAQRLNNVSNIKYFAVACTQEGIELRENNIKNDILVLSRAGFDDFEELYNYKLTPVVYEISILKDIIEFSKSKKYRFPIHIKFDTGMNRIGFKPSSVEEILKIYKENNNYIDIIGIMSHFSSSESDINRTEKQFSIFEDVINYMKASNVDVKLYHIANSGAIVNHNNTHLNAVRTGIMLYGYYPKQGIYPISVKPAMSVKSFVMSVHALKAGEGISYGPSFIAEQDMRVAIIAFGYADGLFRSLSNKFSCIVNDKLCKSVGTICMDMFVIDVSGIDVKVGDCVTIMGESKSYKVDADNLAEFASTINYEILTNIGKSSRVKRVYI